MDVPCAQTLPKLSLPPKHVLRRDPKPKDWNSIIKHHAKLKNDPAILTTYTQMESLRILPNNAAMPLVFKACKRLNAIEKGIEIHSRIRGTNLVKDVRVGTAIIDFYSEFGVLDVARDVFDEMAERDLVSWNALISGYVGCSCHEEALSLFMQMQANGLKPSSRTVVALFLACGETLELRLGREIHGYCLRNGLFDMDAHVDTALIGFYMKFNPEIANIVFNMVVMGNVVSWNAMMSGYVDSGDHLKVLELFIRMLDEDIKIDSVSMLLVIQACGAFGSLHLGMSIHQMAIKLKFCEDLYILNALLNMYSENGSLELSYLLFHSVPCPDLAMWNSMLSAYVEFGFQSEAICLFTEMQTEDLIGDERTVIIMLSSCRELANGLQLGESLHAYALKTAMEMDVPLGNALLSMYAELNEVEAAMKTFIKMRGRDVISWNTLISAFSQKKLHAEARELYQIMQESEMKANSYTMISLLASCEDEDCLIIGRSVHGFVIRQGFEVNVELNTALMEMYMNCGDEATARALFEGYPKRDVISWNALIACYIKNNKAGDALLRFSHMVSEVEPNSVSIMNALASCTHLANLPQGQCVHAYLTRRTVRFDFDMTLANALVTMYARCGSMQYAETIFRLLPNRNIVSWNAMITGYGMHGRISDAILTFLQMLEDGFRPDKVSFLSLLSACSHSGLVETGLLLFNAMVEDFNITPELTHYGSVVDLLCRGGHISKAMDFINTMPIEPDASVWRSVLSACRRNSNTKLAEMIFGKLVELEPENPGNYVLLSNIYAAAGMWPEVVQIRAWLREKQLGKPAGLSWIVVRDQVHCFTSGDYSHPESEQIYAHLNALSYFIREIGHVPDLFWDWHGEGG